MEKAFDVKELLERLKAKGLPMLEDQVQLMTKEVFAWTAESCALKGGLYTVAVPMLPIIAEQVLKLEDKIDGKIGG